MRIQSSRVQSFLLAVFLVSGGLCCAIVLYGIWGDSGLGSGETLQKVMASSVTVALASLLTMSAVRIRSDTPMSEGTRRASAEPLGGQVDSPRSTGSLTNIALAATALVCVGSTGVAIYAWATHFRWQRAGAYAENSFPMGAFAWDATWFAAGVCLAAALGWWFARRRASGAGPTASDQNG